MRVLILWADRHSPNLGVRVIAEGTAALARRAWGEDIAVEFQNYQTHESLKSFGTKNILRDFGRANGPIKAKLRSYDVILDSGAGDSFSDIYGLKRLLHIVYANSTAFRLGLPILMGPQTVGPFNSRIGRWAARNALGHVTLIQTRDSASARYVQSLGRHAVTATDVVFMLPRHTYSKTRDVILNISGILWFSNRHMPMANYRREVKALLLGLKARGRTVSLLAHVLDEDEAAIKSLQEDLVEDKHEVLAPKSVDDVRQILASSQLVIGSRMHACLNALSTGTPTIAWAYSRKFEIIRDIGWDFIVDICKETHPVAVTLSLLDSLESRECDVVLQKTLRRIDDFNDVSAKAMRVAVSRND